MLSENPGCGTRRRYADELTRTAGSEGKTREEVVAALLKVDPEGVTGQRSKKAQEVKERDDA